MTSYHGGKQRIGREIAGIISDIAHYVEEERGYRFAGYCEPFCGMLGVYQHIPKEFEDHRKFTYKAGDANASVIKMWQRAQKGWKPPRKCTEAQYEKLKSSTTPSAERGFIGHACSFGGQYFKAFKNKHLHGLSTTQKDRRVAGQADRVTQIASQMDCVKFSSGNYTQFSNLRNYIIYCDPPYYGAASYYFDENRKLRTFDHEKFWDWCREMSRHNLIFLSGYNPVADFCLVWEARKKAFITGSRNGLASGKEGLFVSVE